MLSAKVMAMLALHQTEKPEPRSKLIKTNENEVPINLISFAFLLSMPALDY